MEHILDQEDKVRYMCTIKQFLIKTRQYMHACKWKPREHAKNPSFCISIELIAAESDLARKIEGMEKMLQKMYAFMKAETCKVHQWCHASTLVGFISSWHTTFTCLFDDIICNFVT